MFIVLIAISKVLWMFTVGHGMCKIGPFQNYLFSFFVLNSPEKPVSENNSSEDEPRKEIPGC